MRGVGDLSAVGHFFQIMRMGEASFPVGQLFLNNGS